MTKFKEYYLKMVRENKQAFDDFTRVHFEYSTDQNKFQNKFNEEGEKIMEIIRDYENKLCANTERGMYNKYSAGLAEKFQQLIRTHFPLIDHIGLIVDTPEPAFEEVPAEQPSFVLKKINL